MKKSPGTCPKKVQYSVMIDEDLVNMLNQMHLVTNKTRSDIINDALRLQLYIPSKFSAKEMKDMEDLVRSIVHKALIENQAKDQIARKDALTDRGARPELASKFEKNGGLIETE